MKLGAGEKAREERKSGVLMEDLDKKLDLVLEGYTALDKKLDLFKGEVDERFREVDFKFDIVFQELRDIRGEMRFLQVRTS